MMDEEAYIIGLVYKEIRGIAEDSNPVVMIGEVLIGPREETDSELVGILGEERSRALRENEAVIEAGFQSAPRRGSGSVYFLEK